MKQEIKGGTWRDVRVGDDLVVTTIHRGVVVGKGDTWINVRLADLSVVTYYKDSNTERSFDITREVPNPWIDGDVVLWLHEGKREYRKRVDGIWKDETGYTCSHDDYVSNSDQYKPIVRGGKLVS